MEEVTLMRSDFRGEQEGISLFDDVLESLGIPEEDRKNIDTVNLKVESVETY